MDIALDRNRAQGGLVGSVVDLRDGDLDTRIGRLDPLHRRAKIEQELARAQRGVGPLGRTRTLEEVLRIVGKIARDHAEGTDAEFEGRRLLRAHLVAARLRLVPRSPRLAQRTAALDRGKHRCAQFLKVRCFAGKGKHGIVGIVCSRPDDRVLRRCGQRYERHQRTSRQPHGRAPHPAARAWRIVAPPCLAPAHPSSH